MGQSADDARNRLLSFLDWDEPDAGNFAEDVRIILVAADFSKELTTAVLWLRDREIDIRCIRFRPYLDNGTVMVDVQQILPLPEAHDYQVQLREKEQQGRRQRAERHDIRLKFWEGLVAIARDRRTRHANIKPGHYGWIGASSGVRGLNFNYAIFQEQGAVELYLDRGDGIENKRIFDTLCANKEGVEKTFGGSLRWERLDAKRACRIKHVVDLGGYRSPESEWPQVQDAMVGDMIRLEAALLPFIEALEI